MPINVAAQIEVFGREEFHALDKKLMRIVFDVHNEFGRLLDESLYKSEIAARWIAAGFGTAEREARISVTHDTFRKDYSMDLLFNRGLMLEAKAAETLLGAHRAQGLNYLFLTGMNHGRLANFRQEKVEHEFLSTRLTPEKRHRIAIHDSNFKIVNAESACLVIGAHFSKLDCTAKQSRISLAGSNASSIQSRFAPMGVLLVRNKFTC